MYRCGRRSVSKNCGDRIYVFNHEYCSSKKEFGSREDRKIDRPRVYVGGYESSLPKFLKKKKITHVIHAMSKKKVLYNEMEEKPVELTLNGFEDYAEVSLVDVLPQCFDFMDSAFNSNPKSRILIHCQAGQSRSPSILCAYIMKEKKSRYEETLKMMRMDRGVINPNLGFATQLQLFEMHNFEITEELKEKVNLLTDTGLKFCDKLGIYKEINDYFEKQEEENEGED